MSKLQTQVLDLMADRRRALRIGNEGLAARLLARAQGKTLVAQHNGEQWADVGRARQAEYERTRTLDQTRRNVDRLIRESRDDAGRAITDQHAEYRARFPFLRGQR